MICHSKSAIDPAPQDVIKTTRWNKAFFKQIQHLVNAAVAVPLLQIVLRKGYHLLAAVLFIPVFFLDLEMLCVSLAIAFAALVAVEVMRCLKVPLLGQAVQKFMQVRWGEGRSKLLGEKEDGSVLLEIVCISLINLWNII
jgi:hypothetical protein